MVNCEELISADLQAAAAAGPDMLSRELKGLLERAYGVQFSILDGKSGNVIHEAPGQPKRDWSLQAELCREAARRGSPEFIADEEPFITLALPILDVEGNSLVAVGTFLTGRVDSADQIAAQAKLLGMNPEDAYAWACKQIPWTAEALKRVNDLVLHGAEMNRRVRELQNEATSLSINLAATYEEISLLYRLTQNLKLSRSDEDLARAALEWMREVVPASGLMIQLLPVAGSKSLNQTSRSSTVLLTHGECPIDSDGFSALVAYLAPAPHQQPTVVNRPRTEQADWPFPQIRELIVVALAEGDNVFGWLAAVNHVEGGEFGTVEANLLSSVAAILGIHGINIELYRQQSELLAGIVRALTSAIDAKDPYTCGHSDRVARVAVRIAQEMGCDEKTLSTLYLAGLLHDIGKIGVDDNVLRKPGRLTDEEYEHIKHHVDIGHHILNDLAKLEEVLPVVLHHHESWDGGGYPKRLNSGAIPLAARIVAVADAYDAMTSDRPYRKGMPDEKVDAILREGAGRQWDPDVVDAFFRAREDIRRIGRGEDQTPKLELSNFA